MEIIMPLIVICCKLVALVCWAAQIICIYHHYHRLVSIWTMVLAVQWAQCIRRYILRCKWATLTGSENHSTLENLSICLFSSYQIDMFDKYSSINRIDLGFSFYNCSSMSAMSSFSHHHHTPPSSIGPLSVSPTHTGAGHGPP